MPNIKMPLTSSIFKDLFPKLKLCLKHNFIPSLLVLAGTAMSFHYKKKKIILLFGGCSMVVALDPLP